MQSGRIIGRMQKWEAGALEKGREAAVNEAAN
jgi:hypothetical protein